MIGLVLPAFPYKKLLRLMAVVALMGISPARKADAASTQVAVTARVLPTRQVAAAQSTVALVAPNGTRRILQLSPQEKLALTSRPGYVSNWLQVRAAGPGIHIIEINF
jgi:hypothetical protein